MDVLNVFLFSFNFAHDLDRDGGRYYADSSSYRESNREGRERSRSRDRIGTGNSGVGGSSGGDHYREER